MSANPPETRPPAFELPSRTQALWFWFRIRMLTLQRMAQDATSPHVRRWPSKPAVQSALADTPVLAELRAANNTGTCARDRSPYPDETRLDQSKALGRT